MYVVQNNAHLQLLSCTVTAVSDRMRARVLLRWCSCRRLSTDTFVPATLNRLDVVERAPIVHSYLSNGFIIRSSVVYGSVGLLPRGFFNWKVDKTRGIIVF